MDLGDSNTAGVETDQDAGSDLAQDEGPVQGLEEQATEQRSTQCNQPRISWLLCHLTSSQTLQPSLRMRTGRVVCSTVAYDSLKWVAA